MFLLVLIVMIGLPNVVQAQTIEWIRQFGAGGLDSASGVAVDTTGIYVVGSTEGTLPGQVSAGSKDAFVRKYNANGDLVWTRQFGSSGDDSAHAVAVEGADVYVVGFASAALPGQTVASGGFVRKYGASGNELWTRQPCPSPCPAGFWRANAVAADVTGVYIGGGGGGGDALVWKYDPNGNELWTRQFGSADVDVILGLATDGVSVYAVGLASLNLPGQVHLGQMDAFVRKFDANGAELWTRQFGSSFSDSANAVAADATGVYVGGYTYGSLPGQTRIGTIDAFLRKYDTNGTELWTRQFGSTFRGGAASVRGVAANSSGVYAAGDEDVAIPGETGNNSIDPFVRKYATNGDLVWTRQFGSSLPDIAYAVAADDDDGVYAAGITFGTLPGETSAGSHDAFVVKMAALLPAPAVIDGGVVNNASYARSPAPLAPGSIAAVFGSNLNDGSTVLSSSFGPDGKLVTTLGGASVTISDIPAPMFYSTPGQLGVQIPFEFAGQNSATIQVTVGGQTSVSRTIFLDSLAPGIFTLNGQGTGAAVVLHQDGVTLVTEQSAARPGEIVVLYGTGLGAVTPPLATGAPSTGNVTVATPTVLIDGVAAEVQFSGAAPGFVGSNQINVRIPSSTRSAPDIPVVLSTGGKQSNTVTIAVGP